MQAKEHGKRSLRELFEFTYLNNKGRQFTREELAPYLNSYITLRTVEKGEDIIRPMDTLRSINLIVNGKAYFIRVSPRGDMNMLASTAAPMFIGITQLFSDDKNFYSQILAAEKCLMLDIDCKYFLQEIKADGDAAMVVIDSLSRIIERFNAWMDRMMFLSSTDNLLAYICRKWLEQGQFSDKPLYIKEKHGVIATDMGVSVRTLYRAINKLKEENLITVMNGGVMMFTPEQLEVIRRRHENM